MVTILADHSKGDLSTLSRQIIGRLQRCDPHSLTSTPETIDRIAVQFNQGALVLYRYGDIPKAEILCHAAIELFARLSTTSSYKALCLAHMVPPYINIARLYAQKGDVEKSLNILDDMYGFCLGKNDLAISGHRISAAEVPAILLADPPCEKAILSCRVVEGVRALQIVEDYPALLTLVNSSIGRAEYADAFFRKYFLEVQSRALLSLNQFDMAISAVHKYCSEKPADVYGRMGIDALLSRVYRESDRPQQALMTLDKLEEDLSSTASLTPQLPTLRLAAYRLALERNALGDFRGALRAAKKAYEWCREWKDQSGTTKSAILLVRICSNLDASNAAIKGHWRAQLQQLASTTFMRLDRACALWELGESTDPLNGDSGAMLKYRDECLRKSYELYCSVPSLDSRQSAEAVKRSLDSKLSNSPARNLSPGEIADAYSPTVEFLFDALMDYVPGMAQA